MTNLLKRNSWTLDLDKLPSYVEWGGDWKYSIDADMVRLILDCDEKDSFGNPKITDVMKTHFKRNVVDKLQNGTLHIKWTARRGNLGRRYSAPDPSDPSRAASNLGVHSKYIKNTLYQYMGWVDYDMVAGHPTILCEIAKKTNTQFPAIEEYIHRRSEIMAELADYYSVVGTTPEETAKNRITPEDIKYLYNLTIYGGGFSTWVKNTTEGDEKHGFPPRPVANRPLHPLYSAYHADVRNASNLIYTFNPQLVSAVCGNENLDEWKRKSRTMSYFCGIIENDCLKYAYKYGVKNGIFPARSGDLCYDGFTMPAPPEGIDLDYHITQMNLFIQKNTGLAIQMKVKPFGSVIQSILDKRAAMTSTPSKKIDDDSRFAANDDQASDILYDEVKDIFKSCNSRLFYLDGNVWTCDKNKIDDIILRLILRSRIYSGTNEKTGMPISYAQNVNKATKIREALYAKIRVQNDDPELYTKFYQNNKKLLCFKDGVLNLEKNTFTLWEDLPKNTVFTTLVIPYDYAEYFQCPNEEAIREIKTAIFEPLFGDKMDTALHFLARAMAGHNEDKRFGTYLGNRNCGKGVLYALLKSAFGDYVKTFELGNIMYCRKTAGMENVDTSKKMYWALDLEGTRLVISQEVPDIKSGMMINGKMLKKLTGGGDDIIARRNYDRCDTLVRLMLTPFMLGNSSLEYDAEDCLEEAVEFCSVVQFKTQAEIDAMREEGRSELEMRRYRVADPNIKQKCETSDEWKRAMVALILRSYKTEKVPIISDATTEQNGLLNHIESIFDLTYNKNDMILTKELYAKLPDFAQKKIKTELNAMNIFDKKVQTDCIYKNRHCFIGIKYKPVSSIPTGHTVNDEADVIDC